MAVECSERLEVPVGSEEVSLDSVGTEQCQARYLGPPVVATDSLNARCLSSPIQGMAIAQTSSAG